MLRILMFEDVRISTRINFLKDFPFVDKQTDTWGPEIRTYVTQSCVADERTSCSPAPAAML